MKKKRFNSLVNNSIYNTPVKPLTLKEWKLGYHYCYDWDGLFIAPHDREFDCCSCHPIQIKKMLKARKKDEKCSDDR